MTGNEWLKLLLPAEDGRTPFITRLAFDVTGEGESLLVGAHAEFAQIVVPEAGRWFIVSMSHTAAFPDRRRHQSSGLLLTSGDRRRKITSPRLAELSGVGERPRNDEEIWQPFDYQQFGPFAGTIGLEEKDCRSVASMFMEQTLGRWRLEDRWGSASHSDWLEPVPLAACAQIKKADGTLVHRALGMNDAAVSFFLARLLERSVRNIGLLMASKDKLSEEDGNTVSYMTMFRALTDKLDRLIPQNSWF